MVQEEEDILKLSLTKRNIKKVLSIISGSPAEFTQIFESGNEKQDIKKQTFNDKTLKISIDNWDSLKRVAADIKKSIGGKTENLEQYVPFTANEPNFFLKSDIKFLEEQEQAKEAAGKIRKQAEVPIRASADNEINFNELTHFLQIVADRQRIQEEKYLKDRLHRLRSQKFFSKIDKKSSKEIGQLMSFLIAFEEKQSGKKDYTTFYKKLTKLLNLLTVGDGELLQKRAKQLTNKEDKTSPELLEILTKISRITSTLINNTNIELENSEQEIVNQIRTNKVTFENFKDYFSFLLYRLIQHPSKEATTSYPQVFNFSIDDITTTKKGRTLKDLLDELEELKNFYHREVEKGTKVKENKQKLKKVVNFIDSLTTTLSNSSLLKLTASQLSLYSIDEQISILQDSSAGILSGGSSSGRKNLADDVRLIFHDNQEQVKEILKQFDELDDFIVSARNSDTTKTFQKAITIENKEFTSLIENLEKLKGGFMIHETDKYYERAFDRKYFEGKAFTGRTMNIFNYITSIKFILNSMGKSIDEQQLAFLTLNSYREAIAAGKKDPLEKIFSIFSGLIMFDDFVLAAKEYIREKIEEDDVQHIHLYRINQFYFPSSYFLYQTLIFLQKEESKIQGHLNNEIVAQIDWSQYGDTIERKRKTNLSHDKILISNNGAGSYNVTIAQPKEEEIDPIWIDFTSGWTGRNIAAKKSVKIKIEFFKDFYKFLEEIFDIK